MSSASATTSSKAQTGTITGTTKKFPMIPDMGGLGRSIKRDVHHLYCAEVWGGNQFVSTDIQLPGLVGTIYSKPCEGSAGGDIHYLSACSGGLVARLCLADVAGHGESVAQMSEWMYQSLRRNMNRPNPSRMFSEMNEKAVGMGVGAMTTAICLTYLSRRGLLYYCYAGHHPALVFKKSQNRWGHLHLQETASAKPSNLPLAVEESTRYDVNAMHLEEGDRVLVFSDGLIEAMNQQGELFGEERLVRVLNYHRTTLHHDLCEVILNELAAFVGHDDFTHDDVTFILLRVTKRQHGTKVWNMMKNSFWKYLDWGFHLLGRSR